MKFLRRRKRSGETLDITPLIDVVFLLNIFFMLTSSYFLYSGIKIKVPAGVSERLGAPDVIVSVTHDGRMFVGNTQTARGGLQKMLHELKVKKPDLQVLIKGDEDARVKHLIDAYSACKQVGIERVQVQTRPMVGPKGAGGP